MAEQDRAREAADKVVAELEGCVDFLSECNADEVIYEALTAYGNQRREETLREAAAICQEVQKKASSPMAASGGGYCANRILARIDQPAEPAETGK